MFVTWSLSRPSHFLHCYSLKTNFISLICLSDSVTHSGTRSIDLCHSAGVSGTMKLVLHRKLGSAEDMEHQFHSAADSGGVA